MCIITIKYTTLYLIMPIVRAGSKQGLGHTQDAEGARERPHTTSSFSGERAQPLSIVGNSSAHLMLEIISSAL